MPLRRRNEAGVVILVDLSLFVRLELGFNRFSPQLNAMLLYFCPSVRLYVCLPDCLSLFLSLVRIFLLSFAISEVRNLPKVFST